MDLIQGARPSFLHDHNPVLKIKIEIRGRDPGEIRGDPGRSGGDPGEIRRDPARSRRDPGEIPARSAARSGEIRREIRREIRGPDLRSRTI
jgi:hypothetical protein